MARPSPFDYGYGYGGIHYTAKGPDDGGGSGNVPPTGGGGGGGGGPAGTLKIPGYTPDYQQLIENDPVYLAYLNNSGLNLANAASSRRAALRALVEQYGGLPSGLTDTYGDLNKSILGLAAANPESELSRLGAQFDQGTLDAKRALAARGALQSGDTGFALGQLEKQRQGAEYDLGQQFASQFQNAVNGYLQAQNQDRLDQEQAIQSAEQDVLSNPMNVPTDSQAAKLVPGSQTQYGQPVYQTADGTMYVVGADGTPVVFTPGGHGGSGGGGGAGAGPGTPSGPPVNPRPGRDASLPEWMTYRMIRSNYGQGY